MKQKMLVNEHSSRVYYTVQTDTGLIVNHFDTEDMGIGLMPRGGKYYEKFQDVSVAKEAANIISGKVFKHTVYQIQTETIEEVEVNE